MTIVIAYIPVVHRGHLKLFRTLKPDVLYVLGKSLLAEIPIIDRDQRALNSLESVLVCRTLSLARKVQVLEKNDLSNIPDKQRIIFVDDEATRIIANLFFSNRRVEFKSAFLRWDKISTLTKKPVIANANFSFKKLDKFFMDRAREQSQKSSDWWRQVGAILVKDGKVLFGGFNKHLPTEHSPYIEGDPRSNFDAGQHIDMSTSLHAEAGLIARAAKEGVSLEGSELYVTTFPCSNCAMLITRSGIKKLYFLEGYSNLNALENLKRDKVKIIKVSDL